MSGICANSCRVTPSRSVKNSDSVEAPVRRMKCRRVGMGSSAILAQVRRIIGAVLDAVLGPRTIAAKSRAASRGSQLSVPEIDGNSSTDVRDASRVPIPHRGNGRCVRFSTRKAGEFFPACRVFSPGQRQAPSEPTTLRAILPLGVGAPHEQGSMTSDPMDPIVRRATGANVASLGGGRLCRRLRRSHRLCLRGIGRLRLYVAPRSGGGAP